MRRFAVLVAMALAAGCASLQERYRAPQARECAQWYQAPDDLLERRFQLDLEGPGR